MGSRDKDEILALREKARKKKNGLIIGAVVAVLAFFIIAIGMSFFSFSKEKVYKKRESVKLDKKDINLIEGSDYKENWALGIENRINDTSKKIETLQKTLVETLKKNKEDTDNKLVDFIASQKEYIQNLEKKNKQQFEDFSKRIESNINKQNQRIEEIAIIASGSGGYSPSNTVKDENGGIISDNDLIPEDLTVDNGKKPKSNKKEKNVTIEDDKQIIKQNKASTDITDELDALLDDNEDGNIVKVDKNKTKISSIKKKKTIQRVQMVSLNTSGNVVRMHKKRLKELKERKRLLMKKKIGNLHIMTGLTQAYLISGVLAPTGMGGDGETLPVLMKAEGDILIANEDTENIDGCFIIGAAKGNMNTQTADIRLTNISCSLANGKKKIEGAISGWVIGEDNTIGVKGELIHKNGAWLSRTFLAGFLKTFADAFGNQGQSQGIPVVQGTSISGQGVKSAAFSAASGGLSSTFGKIGDYYLKMAQQIFPVVQVKGGRTVNILLKGGENLTITEFNKAELSEIEERIAEEEATLAEYREFEYNSKEENSNAQNEEDTILESDVKESNRPLTNTKKDKEKK
jgi:hypothetical protein